MADLPEPEPLAATEPSRPSQPRIRVSKKQAKRLRKINAALFTR